MPAIIPPTSSAQKNMVICFAIRTIYTTFAGAFVREWGASPQLSRSCKQPFCIVHEHISH